jgi:hypothetical protein
MQKIICYASAIMLVMSTLASLSADTVEEEEPAAVEEYECRPGKVIKVGNARKVKLRALREEEESVEPVKEEEHKVGGGKYRPNTLDEEPAAVEKYESRPGKAIKVGNARKGKLRTLHEEEESVEPVREDEDKVV